MVLTCTIYYSILLLLLPTLELPYNVLSVYDYLSSSNLSKRIFFFKRVLFRAKFFRALRARTSAQEKQGKIVEKRIGVYFLKRAWLRRRPNAKKRVLYEASISTSGPENLIL